MARHDPLPWHHALATLPDDVAVDVVEWVGQPVPQIQLGIGGRRVSVVPRYAPALTYFAYVGTLPPDRRSLVAAERIELAPSPPATVARIYAAALKALRRP